jgi:hypothetical protein
VQVPAGEHRLDVIYQDKPFQIGAVLSLLSLAGAGLGWVLFSKKNTVVALNQDTGEPQTARGTQIEAYLPHGAP